MSETTNDNKQIRAATPFEAQLREMYGRCAYTHKTHLKMADALIERYSRIKKAEAWLSGLTSGTLILALLGESWWGTLVGAILSTLLLIIVFLTKEENLGEEAQRHTETASKLWGLREKLLSLLTDLCSGVAEADIRPARDVVNDELERIYKAAPRTNGKAYAAAQRALQQAEELHFSDDELDHLLPSSLRLQRRMGRKEKE